jgi:hypothetical protein
MHTRRLHFAAQQLTLFQAFQQDQYVSIWKEFAKTYARV